MIRRRLSISMPLMGKRGQIVASLLLLVLTLTLAACSGSTSASLPTVTQTPVKTVTPAQPATPTPAHSAKPSGPIDAKWIEPQVNGDIVSVPVREIENDWNTRFKVQTANGDISAMVYMLDGVIYVRANICTPCRSQGFTLSGSTLACDICGTKFSATTGLGVSGSCVNYPIASAAYKIIDGNVVMSKADLVTAYQKTLQG